MSRSQDLIDSLPYIDRDLEDVPGLRETAESLIQAEMAKAGSSSSSGDHPRLPSGLEHDLFANAPSLQSLLASYPDEPLAALDTSRYQLPPPAEGVEGDVEAWKKASDNARAQLEHLNVRHTNLTLLAAHGPNAHLIHNHLLESDAKLIESEVEQLKQQVVDINRKRKNQQTEASVVLKRLEAQWTQLISSTLQTELANAALEAEIELLRRKERELGLIEA